jgi:hypothetical protein
MEKNFRRNRMALLGALFVTGLVTILSLTFIGYALVGLVNPRLRRSLMV